MTRLKWKCKSCTRTLVPPVTNRGYCPICYMDMSQPPREFYLKPGPMSKAEKEKLAKWKREFPNEARKAVYFETPIEDYHLDELD